nr:unnamed protein product [Callosobruchus chinensis]
MTQTWHGNQIPQKKKSESSSWTGHI